jgi:flagellar motor switch protein FliM
VAHVLTRRERSRRSGAAAPIDRRQCIGAQTAQVRVWLGGASIELGVLQTLAIGDVVRLDARIDQPLSLTVEGQATGQRAFLGCLQGKRAVQLAQVRR